MSFITNFAPRLLSAISRGKPAIVAEAALVPGGLFSLPVRNKIRCHFPRPSESKRIKRHGWKTRLSTPYGRRVIMNAILKGRFVLSH